ncbi:MAG: PAS domain S-box protein [Acidobacteriaceae bacterium]|nr:PAS domain S-box protein [Acidobacteriaceae bacterium]
MSAAALLLVSMGARPSVPDQGHPILHVADLRRLSTSEAAQSRPVQIKGIVTALSGWKNSFFLEESGYGISVDRTDNAEVHSGDEVELWGKTGSGLFAPVIVANRVEVLDRRALPLPQKAAYGDLVGGKEDSQWVEIRGVVHSAKISDAWGRQVLFLHIDTGGGDIDARIHDFPPRDFSSLVDATVRVRGVCGTKFNEKRQFVGLRLFVPDLSAVQIEQPPPPANPFASPETGIEGLFRFGLPQSLDHRVKISGTVTYQETGSFLYLQSEKNAIKIETSDPARFAPGARLEAVGFVRPGEYSPVLQDTLVRKIANGNPPAPVVVAPDHVLQLKDGFLFAPFDGLLVRMDGELLSRVDRPGEQVWYMRAGPTLFQAHLKIGSKPDLSLDLKDGDRLRLTGICVTETDQSREPRSFHILLRSPHDVVVTGTRWWTTTHSLWLIALLIVICLAMFIWILQLRRALVFNQSNEIDTPSDLELRFVTAAQRIGSLAIALGLVVLIGGWAFHIEILKTLQPGHLSIKANSALGVLLIGVAVWLNARGESNRFMRLVAPACAIVTIVLSLVTLFEYASGRNLGIDELLFRDPVITAGSVYPGRMSFPTAVALLLLACSALLLRYRIGALISQALAVTASLVCLLNAVGFLYGVHNYFGLTLHQGMALQTSLICLLLSGALLLSSPNRGIMITLTSAAPGGIMARRLLPAALIIPAALGWLPWQGQLKGLYETSVGLSLFACATMVAFSLLIWANGWLLNHLDIERSQAENKLKESESRYRSTLEQQVQERTIQLRESEERFRSLVEGVKDYAIIMLDPDGYITSWNSGAQRMKGYTAQEAIGMHFSHCYTKEDRAKQHPSEILRIAAGEGRYEEESWLVRKDGSRFLGDSVITPLSDGEGRLCGFAKITRDITGQKEIQNALREKNLELEKASREKDRFLATMSHEIRTPLNAILGLADVLRESQLDADQLAYLRVFRRAGANLMTLINDILDVSKIESGHLELERVQFNLKEVVEQAAEVICPKAREKSIELSVKIAPTTETALTGDPTRLRQVLINLLGNAVKFTDKGQITLNARKHSSAQPGYIDFSVSDTGIGIPADKLAAIFGDFTQADSSISRRYGGTGLGLGISRRLVELMGGRLTVSSTLGQGSTFSFTAIFEPGSSIEPNSSESHPANESYRDAPLRILIAEDSPDNRMLLQLYMKGAPHRLIFAVDGRRAIEEFERERFDLILMDMQMPGMDGLTATRKIREIERDRNLSPVPIVALTANARKEDVDSSLFAGCNGHLSKPISKQMLIKTIEEYATPAEDRESIEITSPEGLEDLVPEYLAGRKDELPLLAAYIAASDFAPVQAIAHNLKGTGTSFGFEELSRLGAALERSAKQADAATLTKQLNALETYLNKIKLAQPALT